MTSGGRRGLAWLTLVAAAWGGCAVQKQVAVDFSETPRDYLAGDYQSVYQRWTRHDYASLDRVDKSLEVWATFKSWDFREAFIENYAAIYSLSDAKRAELRQGQRDLYHVAYEFHVTAQSANWDWNDLEKANTPWVVTLVDALGHELPSERVQIQKLPDAFEREFFPAKTPFSKTYKVRFIMPAPGGDFAGVRSGSLTLRFASPIGRIDLVWKS
ncbi:MAG TPA: hypothetical protein VH853_12360 [Polyangia bacterium]|jgi:hypothetical protein|nr:hypothetical protein [Polyangia bacterium]